MDKRAVRLHIKSWQRYVHRGRRIMEDLPADYCDEEDRLWRRDLIIRFRALDERYEDLLDRVPHLDIPAIREELETLRDSWPAG